MINLYICNLRRYIYLLLALICSSCGFSEDYCVDADDFGFPKISVAAHDEDEDEDGKIYGYCPNQYREWKDTELVLTGGTVVAYVSGGSWDPYGDPYDLDSAYETECSFYNNDYTLEDSDGEALALNAPCILKNGVGLYILFAPDGKDPNSTAATIQKPDDNGFVTYHMGENDAYYAPRDKAYSKGINGSLENLGASLNDRVYMKILDTCYTGNTGSYTVTFKSGVASTNNKAFIQPLIDTVRSTLDSVYETLFTSLVENGSFISYVRILIMMFIMYRAYLFLVGKVKGSLSEFIADILKAAIVATLISSYAWDFFYTYVFTIFIDGVDQLIAILVPDNLYGTGYYDLLLQSMLSKELWYKILAIMNVPQTGSFFGLAFGLLIIWAICVFIYATFLAAIFYMLSLIGMGVMIAVAPIFITLWLFQETKQLFEQWYKQLFIYLLQPVLIFAFLVFFFDMIYGIFYDYLGIRVCSKSVFPGLNDFRGIATAYEVYPGHEGENYGKYYGTISIPETFYDGTKYCAAYECSGDRWYDAPFLDPNDEWDAHRLEQLEKNDMGGIFDVLYLWVLITVLIQCQEKVPLLVGAMIRGQFFSWQTRGNNSAWGAAESMMNNAKGLISGARDLVKAGTLDKGEKDPDSDEARSRHGAARRLGSYTYNAGAGLSNFIRNPTKAISNILRPDVSVPKARKEVGKEWEFWKSKFSSKGGEGDEGNG